MKIRHWTSASRFFRIAARPLPLRQREEVKGYDVQFGARPLKRAIQTYIEDGVCELLLGDSLTAGETIVIGKNPNKDELTFTPQS